MATVKSRFAALQAAQSAAGGVSLIDIPAMRDFMRGAARSFSAPPRQAPPMRAPFLARVRNIALASDSLRDRRDAAILHVLYAACLRGPSELLPLCMGDVRFDAPNMAFVVRVGVRRRTKCTTAPHEAFERWVPEPAASMLRRWLDVCPRPRRAAWPLFCAFTSDDQPLWMSPVSASALSAICRDRASETGEPWAAQASSHGLRRGRITDLLATGQPIDLVRKISGHRSEAIAAYVSPSSTELCGIGRFS